MVFLSLPYDMVFPPCCRSGRRPVRKTSDAGRSILMPEVLSTCGSSTGISVAVHSPASSAWTIATRIAVGTIQVNDRPSDLLLADEFLLAQRESQMDGPDSWITARSSP